MRIAAHINPPVDTVANRRIADSYWSSSGRPEPRNSLKRAARFAMGWVVERVWNARPVPHPTHANRFTSPSSPPAFPPKEACALLMHRSSS